MKKNDSHSIIGGMFGLPESVAPIPSTTPPDLLFLNKSNLFMGNARSGIFVLVGLLKPANVWMPSYLCSAMLQGVDQRATELKFYEVDYDLQIPSLNWIKQIQTGDLVVLIDYFGFPLSPRIVSMVKNQGGYVLEDACQAMLSDHVGRYSDFVLFSPRKFVGVPDGGILASCSDIKFDNVELKPASESWWLKMLEATIKRREFEKFGGDRCWYKLFQEGEAANSHIHSAISDLSQKLLFNAFDFKKIAKRRIENYLILTRGLKDIAMYPVLPEGTAPLGFPVRHPARDQLQAELFQERIYPPVHWPIEGVVPREFSQSHRLARRIMTLPCDQRYCSDDMYHLISCIKKIQTYLQI